MRWSTKAAMIIGFCLSLVSAGMITKSLGKLIIDTDAGGDDAAAILYMLAEQELAKNDFEVVAITCTYGNTNVTNVATNVLKILTIANRSDIPVYIGASGPILKHYVQGDYFGKDGFGDFKFDEEIIAKVDQSKHASVAMVDIARENPENVSIVALGPMTNIALASKLDPSFIDNVNRFYIMGSCVRGTGNVAPNVEYNFSNDPHGNFIVLNATRKKPAIIFPWETTVFANISMSWRKDILGVVDSKVVQYLNKIEKPILDREPKYTAADLMLGGLVLRPQLIMKTLVTNLIPVFDGLAQGSVLVDYANTTGMPANVEIVETFDVPHFKRFVLRIFSDDQ